MKQTGDPGPWGWCFLGQVLGPGLGLLRAAAAGVIRRDEELTSLEQSEQVALVFSCTAPWDQGEGSRD